MSSFNIPFDTFRATCGWKIRTLLLLVCASLFIDSVRPMDCPLENRPTCMEGQTFFNNTTCRCEECRRCDGPEMFEVSACTLTKNAVCDCRHPTFYDDAVHQCLLSRCADCPSGECRDSSRKSCRCERPECHSPGDLYCRNENLCGQAITILTTPSTRPDLSPFDQETFPAWGFGLIAVGIVIGIIIFASCFLCMGLFSMHTKRGRDAESQGSEGSENGLVSRESFGSANTNSSYLSSSSLYPYLTNHNMLELLKSSNSQLVKPSMSVKVSSLQSSPVSSRSSPKPGRTVRLAKIPDSKKLTAIL